MNRKENNPNDYQKDFKYTLKSKSGKLLLESIIRFGSKSRPFPINNWKDDALIQIELQDYKQTFIADNFDIEITEL